MRTTRPLILTILLVVFGCTPTLLSHDEPPKTARELADQQQARSDISTLGIERQQVWAIAPGGPDGPADSSLWYTNRYDQTGNLIEQTIYDTSGNIRSVCCYDDRNTWLEELYYIGDSLDDRTVFVYNRDGLIVRVTSYDSDGVTTGQLDYEYLTDSAQILLTKRITDDSVQYRLRYVYEPGSDYERQIEAVQTNADGSLRLRTENQFTDGRRSKKLVYGADNVLTHSFSYTYTPEGDFHEVVKYDSAGSVVSVQTYEYTPDGLLQAITDADPAGDIRRILRYTYD